jgi:heat-inducible transcriptional repressor
MAGLEELGLLYQPHASAGRVPTDQAYRVYADELLNSRRRRAASADDEGAIQSALAGAGPASSDLMERASRVLSHLSGRIGLVAAPPIARLVLDRVEFVRLERLRVLVLLVDPAGLVTHRQIEVTDEIEQPELDRMSGLVREHFAGLTVPQARRKLAGMLADAEVRRDALSRRALDVTELCLADRGADEPFEVYVGGVSTALDAVEAAPATTAAPTGPSTAEARQLLEALEERRRLYDLLGRFLEADGVQVLIGTENEDPRLHRWSVFATPCSVDGRRLGAVGLIGPTRMEYGRAIVLVETLSRALGQALCHQGA